MNVRGLKLHEGAQRLKRNTDARDAGNVIRVGLAFAANHLGKDVVVFAVRGVGEADADASPGLAMV